MSHAVGEFTQSFLEALVIVLAVSFLSLGWRTGVVVALQRPAGAGHRVRGDARDRADLHRITLGALIIALGLLVDDAIIAVEMMVVKMEEGWDRVRAATFAWTSTAFPMLTGTLVTVAGFLPIGFANSAAGEYAGGIFWVVGIALIASLARRRAVHAVSGGADAAGLRGQAGGARRIAPRPLPYAALSRAARAVIACCVRRRGVVVLATVGLFAAVDRRVRPVQQQFFPHRPSGRSCSSSCACPRALSFSATEAASRQAEALLKGDPDIATYTSYVGEGSPRFYLALNPQLPDAPSRSSSSSRRTSRRGNGQGAARRSASPTVRFRRRGSRRRPLRFRPAGRLPGAVPRRRPGPAGGARRSPIACATWCARNHRRASIPTSTGTSHARSVRLEVDQDRARALGLTPQDVSQTLQTLLSGVTAHHYPRRHRGDRRGRARGAERTARPEPHRRPDDHRAERRGGAGRTGRPRRVLARRSRSCGGATATWRSRCVPTCATACRRRTRPTPIWPKLGGVRAELPPGYRVEIGGAIEESAKANASIFALFPVMLIVMLAVLMVQLQNFSRLFLVLLTAPLGIDRRVARAERVGSAVRVRGVAGADRAGRA